MSVQSKRKRRQERQERLTAVERELGGLRSSLQSAYSLFNHTADPEMVEASVLEIQALQSRYSMALRNLKLLYQEGLGGQRSLGTGSALP